MIKWFRVVEMTKGKKVKYVCQARGWFGIWRGLDTEDPGKYKAWYDKDSMFRWSSFDNKEAAFKFIEDYKESNARIKVKKCSQS